MRDSRHGIPWHGFSRPRPTFRVYRQVETGERTPRDAPPRRRPDGALVFLSVALGLSLLVIGFLLGRSSLDRRFEDTRPGSSGLGHGPASRAEEGLAPAAPPSRDAHAPSPSSESREGLSAARAVELGRIALEAMGSAPPTTQGGLEPSTDPTEARLKVDAEGHITIQNEAARSSPYGPNDAARGLVPDADPHPSAPSSASHSQEGQRALEVYFERVHRIQSTASGDPNALAQELLASLLQGDGTSFDALTRSFQSVQREVRALEPPPSCIEYHRELLALIADSQAILSEVKRAVDAHDAPGLAAIAGRGEGVKTRVEALDRVEKALLRRR